MPLGRPFDGFVEHTKRVSPTCLVNFERNRYSVPASFANRPVSLRIYPERIVVAAEGQILCEHARIIERSHHLPGRTVYDWRHYLAVIQRKPGALRNGAPFAELPEAFSRLQGQLLKRLQLVTGRWSRSWPSCSNTTSRRCCVLLSWLLPRAGVCHQDPCHQRSAPADGRQIPAGSANRRAPGPAPDTGAGCQCRALRHASRQGAAPCVMIQPVPPWW